MKRLNYLLTAVALVAISIVASAQDRGSIEQIGEIYSRLGQVQGVALQGDFAYIADMNSGLSILDLSDPSAPTLTGKCDPNEMRSTDIQVAGQYAFLIEGPYVQVIDASNPTKPVEVGSLYNQGGWVVNSTLNGDRLYLADLDRGIRIINLSDPLHPYQEGIYETPSNGGEAAPGVHAIAVYNDDVIFAAFNTRGICAIDVSDPVNPTVISELGWVSAQEMVISGQYLYATESCRGLYIYHINEDFSLEEVNFIQSDGWANCVAIDGSYAYLTTATNNEQLVSPGKMEVIDISVPEEASIVAELELPRYANDVAFANGYLTLGCESGAVITLNVADPMSPSIAGMYDQFGYIVDVSLSGNIMAVADGVKGLSLVDISDPANPVETYQYVEEQLLAVFTDENYAYLASAEQRGLTIIALSDEAENRYVGSIETYSLATDVVVEEGIAYVALAYGGMQTFDVRDPANPTLLGSFWLDDPVYAIDIENGIVYLASEGLLAIDVYDPSDPEFFASVVLSGRMTDLVVVGPLAYGVFHSWFHEFSGLYIFDLSDPVRPAVVGALSLGEDLRGIAVEGKYAYVTLGEVGLRVVDISNEFAPVEVAARDTRICASKLQVRNGQIFVADLYSVGIFEFTAPNSVNRGADDAEEQGLNLMSAYPNPFNSVAKLTWSAPAATPVRLSVYSITGAKVADLVNGVALGGRNETLFNAEGLPTGAYVIRLEAAGKAWSQPIRLVR